MHVRVHATPLRVAACLSAALVAFAAVADSEASCTEQSGAVRLSAAGHHDEAPPSAPAQDCAGRPCRTPVSVAAADPAVQVIGTVSSFVAEPVRPPISADPAAPPTPPPVERR